jgi:hypothetical protein
MAQIQVPAATDGPLNLTRDDLRRAADREHQNAYLGASIGVGQVIVGVLLVVMGLAGAEEFVAGSARIVTMPAGALFAVAGAIVIWITRPTIDYER